MFKFKLPDLGEGIHEGEILKWHVSEGDIIKEDEPLVDFETDKAVVTIPSPKNGIVSKLAGKVGDIVQVGDIIAIIDDSSVYEPPLEKPHEVKEQDDEDDSRIDDESQSVSATPATRRLARELGVNIGSITPSGPGGKVTPDDVKAYVQSRITLDLIETKPEKKPDASDKIARAEYAARASNAIPFLDIEELPDFAEFGPVEKKKLLSIRRKIAHKMVTSMLLVPHVTHVDDADVTELEKFRQIEKEKRKGGTGEHLTLLPFVVKAVAATLMKAEVFNTSLDPFNEEIIYKKYYNIGIAVNTPTGLIVPVIRDANSKSILQISDEIYDLAIRARVGKIDVQELRGGTFTISNVGAFGGTITQPAINYPEVAILGMGKVQDKPAVFEGKIEARKIVTFTLSFDHRVADGADAANFVTAMINTLTDPALLNLDM